MNKKSFFLIDFIYLLVVLAALIYKQLILYILSFVIALIVLYSYFINWKKTKDKMYIMDILGILATIIYFIAVMIRN